MALREGPRFVDMRITYGLVILLGAKPPLLITLSVCSSVRFNKLVIGETFMKGARPV